MSSPIWTPAALSSEARPYRGPVWRLVEDAGITTIRSRSVRDPNGGCKLAVLHCAAFAEPAPIERRSWRLRLGPAGVQAICEFPLKRIELAWEVFKADERVRSLL